ncbi:MAG TPA: energy transducer TonB [Terriglobales bacterium]|nr:energy transducer TonB [Terriglobales bacterium]
MRLVGLILLLYAAVAPAGAQRVECGVLTGKVVHMVRPKYPEVAKAAGIQGEVVLEALVGTEGEVLKLRVVRSASPLLSQAAVGAVEQWRYLPLRLDGKAVEFETTIRVRFVLPKKKGGATQEKSR